MEPRIEVATPKKLVGKRTKMSLTNDTTFDLWKSFMTTRKEIQNTIGTDRYSVQVFPPTYFENFNPNTAFEKWATMEVSDKEIIPDTMEKFHLQGGLYAVFHHKNSNSATSIFEYIFSTWLPSSKYNLDNRPHFEVLGKNYRNNDPNSEEEIWIPIRQKLQ